MENKNNLTFGLCEENIEKSSLTPMMVFTAAVFAAGTGIFVGGNFPSAEISPVLCAVISALSLVAVYLLENSPAGKKIPAASYVLTAVFCIVFAKNTVSGLGVLANDILSRMSIVTGKIYLDFASADTANALWAVIPLFVLCAACVYNALTKASALYLVPVIVPLYICLAAGIFPVDAGCALIFFGAVLCFAGSVGKIRNTHKGYAGKAYYIVLPALCLAVMLGVGYFSSADGIPGRITLADSAHEKLYDSTTNAMPEGNLRDLGVFGKSDTAALEITMQENQKMYLRGSIYEVYDGSSWKKQDNEFMSEYEDLFFSLHDAGFSGQSQIGLATSAAGETDPLSMTVKNISACSAHGYYPYGIYTDTVAEEYLGDFVLPETENISFLTGSVPEWYLLQQSLALNQQEDAVKTYLAAEEAYEKYVNEADLQLTDESWSLLNDRLGQSDSMSLSDIRDKIREFLGENLMYDERAVTSNGSLDFADYTLTQSGSGYSVHYATLATLMLRYYGVPARYVEGYFISEEEALSYENGDTITLTENHAHAWAEYYLPGVGFVPFEVTPGYMDDEEDEIGTDNSIGGIMYVSDNLKYAQVKKPEQIEEPKQNKMTFSMKPEYLLYLMIAVLMLVAALILRRRSLFRKAMENINSSDNRNAISLRYAYAAALMASTDTGEVEGSEAAEQLNREAIFSLHEMSDEQRAFMDRYAVDVLSSCKEKWTFMQKMRYLLWDCLY